MKGTTVTSLALLTTVFGVCLAANDTANDPANEMTNVTETDMGDMGNSTTNMAPPGCLGRISQCVMSSKLYVNATDGRISCEKYKGLKGCATTDNNGSVCSEKEFKATSVQTCLFEKVMGLKDDITPACLTKLDSCGDLTILQNGMKSDDPEKYFCDYYKSEAFKNCFMDECSDNDYSLFQGEVCSGCQVLAGTLWTGLLLALLAMMVKV
ncbi:uncharacterized protein LOC106012623 [Aplysia californica]|uniref:Uncharacterized protein LOC106012623 n=1 Tax=Aplysia californica TaxID=6500 RepID=A0ABM1A661_APLCA|nr:uncharacterized protein LOC106012623 [Aplysia californica]